MQFWSKKKKKRFGLNNFSSLYTYTWDIKMDWGLFDKNSGENKFLREEIVYSSKRYYYFAIIEDFALRYNNSL